MNVNFCVPQLKIDNISKAKDTLCPIILLECCVPAASMASGHQARASRHQVTSQVCAMGSMQTWQAAGLACS